MVMILDESNFIAKNLNQIVEPSMQIKAYLHQRKLLQAFNIINLFFELALVTKYALNHDAMLINYQAFALKQGWGSDAFAFGAVVCTCMIYNIITLVFGIYAIERHRPHLHSLFMWLLAFSILFESFICVFVLTNLMAAIPRVLLFAYENFVVNSLLYPILVIEVDQE